MSIFNTVLGWLRALRQARQPRLRFFWIGEETEIFVAYSLEQAINAFVEPEDRDDTEYGELSEQAIHRPIYARDDETGRFAWTTIAEEGASCRVIPNCVLSSYA